MRILYTHTINQMAETYARELSLRGHTTSIYQPDLRGAGTCWPYKLACLPARALNMAWEVRKFHPRYFDLVHIHWASYGIFGTMGKIPMIIHCHGSDVRKRLLHPLIRPVLASILQQAAAVLCVTPDLLPIVHTVRPDAYFTPAPIDTELFIPNNQESKLTGKPWTILLFARLDPDKGSKMAVEGITRFVQQHPEVRVVLLDWGPLKEHFKQLVGKQFEFIPPVPLAQVPTLIQSADVVVGQFALGALGLSELQAMSCEKPVICSFTYPKAYPSSAPLCQANRPEEIERELEQLFQQPEAGKILGQAARKWIQQYHSSRSQAISLETLYYSILTRNEAKTA